MSTLEKISYFLVALALYAVILVTASKVPNSTSLEQVAMGISLIEATHWYYGIRNKRAGLFWGVLVVVATMMFVIKTSTIAGAGL